jgi:hypothetical protein
VKSHGTAWGFGGFFSSLKFIRIRQSPRASHPAGKLSILWSSSVEYRRLSRDMPALGPNWLEAAPQPPAGARLLGIWAPQSLGLRCHRPACRSVTSHRLQSCRLLRRPNNSFSEALHGMRKWCVPSKHHALDGSSSLIKLAHFFVHPSSLKSRTSRGPMPIPPSRLLLCQAILSSPLSPCLRHIFCRSSRSWGI